jgi:hypothetical protein
MIVIASEAKQSIVPQERMDCFVASLLAMTEVASPRTTAAKDKGCAIVSRSPYVVSP